MSEKLPEGWQRFYFGEAVQIATGQVDPKQKPYSQMLHIGPENIESGTGNITNVKYCAELGLISGKYLFDEHSIIYSKIRPNLNKACMPNFKGVCSADTYPLWPRDRLILLPEYLLLFILTQKFTKQAIAASKRTGMPKINREDLNAIEIILPPLHEQKIIIKVVSTWDAAITYTKKLLEKSKQQQKALMQQLLTGRRRLPGFNKKWISTYLKLLLNERSKRNRNSQIHIVLSVTNHRGFVIQEEQFSKRVASKDISNYKIVEKGQFAYNPSRINVGSFARLDSFDWAIVSPLYTVFSISEAQKLHSDFFMAWMQSDMVAQRITLSTQGSVRDSVSFDALCSLNILLPPLEEQKAIAAVLSAADALIAQYEARLAHLQKQKKALMQQLLTGKIRVTPDTPDATPGTSGDACETPA